MSYITLPYFLQPQLFHPLFSCSIYFYLSLCLSPCLSLALSSLLCFNPPTPLSASFTHGSGFGRFCPDGFSYEWSESLIEKEHNLAFLLLHKKWCTLVHPRRHAYTKSYNYSARTNSSTRTMTLKASDVDSDASKKELVCKNCNCDNWFLKFLHFLKWHKDPWKEGRVTLQRSRVYPMAEFNHAAYICCVYCLWTCGAHLLLGNPAHSIIKQLPPLKASTASISSYSHTAHKLLSNSAMHVLELFDAAEFYKRKKEILWIF